MRRRSGKRPSGANKKQSKITQVPSDCLEVENVELSGGTVTIEFTTIADAKRFFEEFNLQMEIEAELQDYEEDPMDGVRRTLKVN